MAPTLPGVITVAPFSGSVGVRTSYDDEPAWQALRTQAQAPSEERFLDYITFLDDPALADLSTEDVPAQLDPTYEHSYLFIVDDRALSVGEHPVLVVNLHEKDSNPCGRPFRVIASELWSLENNLSISNMDFEEFAARDDVAGGVFRGF